MPIAKKTIDGYTAEIEPNEDRESVNCYVSRGKYAGSLALLEGEGYLLHESSEATLDVNPDTIDRIRACAEQHGY